ncbi:hypothetical protein T484DRAFT_1761637 [Baffinella frigidus]|nr:hypothetical protein T484DRAFT_1761637 [Cryptophyta sp. CCMP2293]
MPRTPEGLDPDAPDFDGSLLRCLLNGLGWERSTGQLWQKLELAIRWKRVDVMEIILDRTDVKGDKKKEAIQRALHVAISLDRVEFVQRLFECTANCTPALHVAISLDRVEFVQRLFERGADPRALRG